jgi:hypothetical protein
MNELDGIEQICERKNVLTYICVLHHNMGEKENNILEKLTLQHRAFKYHSCVSCGNIII